MAWQDAGYLHTRVTVEKWVLATNCVCFSPQRKRIFGDCAFFLTPNSRSRKEGQMVWSVKKCNCTSKNTLPLRGLLCLPEGKKNKTRRGRTDCGLCGRSLCEFIGWTLSLSLSSRILFLFAPSTRGAKANSRDAIIPNFLGPDPELHSELPISCNHV